MAGVGSPKGVRQGGRQKGTPNKATKAREQIIAAAGQTPLAFMLELMQDQNADLALRFQAAKGAAPYVHPSLSSVALGNKPGEAFKVGLLASDLE